MRVDYAPSMAVVDKYIPVPAAPRSLTPVVPTLIGAVAVALVLALFSPQTFVAEATFPESPAAWATVSAPAVERGAQLTGLGGLRAALDAKLDGLDAVGKIFVRPGDADAGGESMAAAVETEIEAAEEAAEDAGQAIAQKAPGTGAAGAGLGAGASASSATKSKGKTVRILIVGASSIQHALGTELERELVANYGNVVVKRRGKAATGLARPDVFDWSKEVRALVREFRPDVVIGQFGGNDAQNIVDDQGKPHTVGSDSWKAEYTKRLVAFVAEARRGGAQFYLLGLPAMKSPKFNRTQRMLDEVSEQAVRGAGAHFISIYEWSVDAKGNYMASVKFNGESGLMRMGDGIHFTRLGGQYVAHKLAKQMEGLLGLVLKTSGAQAAGDALPETTEPAAASPASSDAPSVSPSAPPPAASSSLLATTVSANAAGALEPPFARPVEASMATVVGLTVPSTTRGPSPMIAFVPQAAPGETMPVWILLHGADASYMSWSEHARDELRILAAEHHMIIAMPDGEKFGWWLDATQEPAHKMQTWLLGELVPWIDANLPSNGMRAISGISMGGHGALTAALASPGTFVAVTSMSGAVDLPFAKSREALQRFLGPYEQHQADWQARSALHLVRARPRALSSLAIMTSCGRDDIWFPSNLALHEALAAAGVLHVWEPVAGSHTWVAWKPMLPRQAAFVARAFAVKAMLSGRFASGLTTPSNR